MSISDIVSKLDRTYQRKVMHLRGFVSSKNSIMIVTKKLIEVKNN